MSEHGQGHGKPQSVEAARKFLLGRLQRVVTPVKVAVRDALDRILAADIVSPIAVPGHDNSAMDGYALRGADLPQAGTAVLRVVGDAFAGHPFTATLGAGECVRIMTGGVVPAGADTVIMQEEVEAQGAAIVIGGGHRVGENVRKAGEDLAPGTRVLETGRRVTAADLGLIASLGLVEVSVQRRLRVAFFSTGDELRSLGQPLGVGEIYDSNRYSLYGMLTRFGADVFDLGVVRDDPPALAAAFRQAGAMADVVMTSGGVSVGAADHIKTVLAEVGEVGFWKVNMKPGKPLAFGRLHDGAVFFGLPGNPVSAMVTYYQIVQPALDHMAGAAPRLPVALLARTREALRKKTNRREFQRGILEFDAAGQAHVRSAAPQGSGILRSMSRANCFIVLAEETGAVAAGDLVRVEPFAGLV